MPSGNDTVGFHSMLMALVEVARPNTGQSEETKAFLRDMLEGIQSSLADD
jgi:hypothetical protein